MMILEGVRLIIYVTGDTHGGLDIGKLSLENFNVQQGMTKDDFVIVAGDFGLVFSNTKRELELRKELAAKNFSTLFIDGNHENFNILDGLPKQKWNGGLVNFINDSIIHLCRGQVYELQGLKIFTFGGANSIDKEIRTEGVSWWPREMPSPEEYAEGLKNLDINNWQVDYIISHDCSFRTFEKLKELAWEDNPSTPLRDYFDEVEKRLSFRKWFFGHYHDDIDIDDKHTLLYRNIIRIV